MQSYYEYTTGLPPQHPQPPTIQQQQQQLLLQQQRAMMQHQQQQQQQQGGSTLQQQHQQHMLAQPSYGGSPQRRFLSEGELVRQGGGGGGNELAYARSNNTVDNIRELAGSPQRGVYMWKDTSPGFNGNNVAPPTLGAGAGGVGGVPSSVSLGSSAGTMPNSMHHAQYITVGGGGQAHPLIMTHSRMQQAHDYAQQQQYHRSNPTSPTTMPSASAATAAATSAAQTYMLRYGNAANVPPSVAAPQPPQTANYVTMATAGGGAGGYQPQLRGGIAVFTPNPIAVAAASVGAGMQQQQQSQLQQQQQPSPQIKRKQTPTRPMSFVRALEMTDSMEMQTLEQQQSQQQQQQQQLQHQQPRNNAPGGAGMQPGTMSSAMAARNTTPTPDRASVYDMNYEISV